MNKELTIARAICKKIIYHLILKYSDEEAGNILGWLIPLLEKELKAIDKKQAEDESGIQKKKN